jgi:benzoyl-CoA reductase/2-hydroxyglutaryl-CoA dehydratase subunit BcrC/BadD/HgdB
MEDVAQLKALLDRLERHISEQDSSRVSIEQVSFLKDAVALLERLRKSDKEIRSGLRIHG